MSKKIIKSLIYYRFSKCVQVWWFEIDPKDINGFFWFPGKSNMDDCETFQEALL